MDWVTAFEVVFSLGALIVKGWAFYDATRFTPEQYKATERMPRWAWLILLGATIVLQIWLGGFEADDPLGARSLTFLATVLMVVVYFYDMRPKLQEQRYLGV